ncbi:MAG: alkene reductase [Acidobacteria bacterium]|nr:alkene reductase [Acidobacteriota bacterium]
MDKLFEPLTIGRITLPNRIVMAPMTRSRASAQGVPSELAIEYYSSRAQAGLLVTEATQTSPTGQGYARTPGLHNDEQSAAWKKIVDAVHKAGGRIFLQLFHVGRISHLANRTNDGPPVAPSSIPAAGNVWTDTLGMQPFDSPRALETAEIPAVIEEFASATRRAIGIGFDGVELHAASGYLHMQFLSSSTNRRTDAYGTNRLKFVVETLEAMVAAAGDSKRVGVKLSPAMPFNDISDDTPHETYSALTRSINPLHLAYLHLMRVPGFEIAPALRAAFTNGAFFLGGGYDYESAQRELASGGAGAIVFGKPFIANPDLPARFRNSIPLAVPDSSTFYTPGAKGYIDYPAAPRV